MTLTYGDLKRKLARLGDSYNLLLTYREDVREKVKAGEAWEETNLLRDAVENQLRICSQVCLDIAKGVLILEDALRAKVEENPIIPLGKKGILPPDFAKKFAGVKGFRNVIVHEYESIDYKMIAENLEQAEDFEEFSRYIAAYLRKKLASSDELASPPAGGFAMTT